MNLYKLILLPVIFLISIFLPFPISASTLTPSVPWGARNSYTAFDGSGWDAFFNVSFPDFGPGVDIYQGTDGTARVGPYSAPYPQDPTAYFTGFTAGQTITFRTTITNTSSKPGRDNFWFSVSRVIDCPGFSLSSSTLTEQNLYDCSVEGNRIITNQRVIFWSPALTYHDPNCETGIDGKFCLNISNIAPNNTATLTYTWTPTETGYYQFDFGSDDYGHDFQGATAYAAGFIRIIPPPPPPPPPGNKSCSITRIFPSASLEAGNDALISFGGWGSSTTTPERVGLWVENKNSVDPINPAPQVNSNSVAATIVDSRYYYRLDEDNNCNATSAAFCSYSIPVTLPAGEYWVHCDLPDDPVNRCSGNPFCTINGGALNCGNWVSCSSSDYTELIINPKGPAIDSLQIGNNPNRDSFTTTFQGSGRQTGSEGGKGWFNPMTITLNATKGTGDIRLFVSAFYDKKQGFATDQQALSSLTAIEGQINAEPARGFMLAYAAQNCPNQAGNCLVDNTGFGFTIGKYYAYVKGSGWVDISGYDFVSNGFPVENNSNQIIYRVYAGSAQANWQVRLYKEFDSKNMYTPGFVIDSNNLPNFQPDLTPIPN